MRIPPHHDPACWGCGDNPNGLHLPLPAAEGLTEYEAYFHFDERHQGGPGIVHGGLVERAGDETAVDDAGAALVALVELEVGLVLGQALLDR